ncbi:MAG: hypothetical protein PWQ22_709 [Archaeoglobaceae archaeon]|nr:hypothetical protein [Archaeoglobaceae archaeon]
MEILKLWIHQTDCPFIISSDDFEVKFYHNLIEVNNKTTVKRGYITSKDPEELQNCLEWLFGNKKLLNHQIYEKCPNYVLLRMDLTHTHAMDLLLKNKGYIVGPFIAEKGREVWQVGFDEKESMENFLDGLYPDDYTILRHCSLPSMNEMCEIIGNIEEIALFVNTLKELTPTERNTLKKAIESGYYDQPKKANITELSDAFNISKVAVYKNLKRAENKIMKALLRLLLNAELNEQDKGFGKCKEIISKLK